MAGSEKALAVEDTSVYSMESVGLEGEALLSQRRLRHIASIQVRNLTPYPVRDTLASSLSHRTPTSTQGMSVDDSDILLSRKRTRRVSSVSLNNSRTSQASTSALVEDSYDSVEAQHSPTFRRRTSSKASSLGSPPVPRQPQSAMSTNSTPPIKRTRARATSQASIRDSSIFASSSLSDAKVEPVLMPSPPRTQKELEDIIWSRLVETFLTINLQETAPLAPSQAPSHARSESSSSRSGILASTSSVRKVGNASTVRRSVSTLGGPSSTANAPTTPPSIKSNIKPKRASSASVSSAAALRPSDGSATPSSSPRKITFPHSPPPTPPPSHLPKGPYIPFYISPFHRPSTNPRFTMSARDRDFADWADLRGDRMSVKIWGLVRTRSGWGSPSRSPDVKGKGKEPASPTDDEPSWQVLRAWDINLNEMVLLPDDLARRTWRLPSNTLLVTLASGRTYCLPSTLEDDGIAQNRPNSPEYNSDPEGDVAHVRKHADREVLSNENMLRGRGRRSKRENKTAPLQDLVKLVSLQTVLADTEHSLQDVLRCCDELLLSDKPKVLRREISEREYRLQQLSDRVTVAEEGVKSVQAEIEKRKRELAERRIDIKNARAEYEKQIVSEFENGSMIAEDKKRHADLLKRLTSARTSLLSTLSFIFPIELLSPPDLLFTILNVPLPIPTVRNEPAPPLSLPGHKNVNEDSVATALGYAALVVNLTAAYMSFRLAYPITYFGSRSLIKDPISKMMGPRMFPLYSRGVDTYRFEYAVFLLNKDVELLMAERNLRALDLRHTLPNLKNLLLTLTSNETLPTRTRSVSSLSISSGLQSPIRTSTPDTTTTPPSTVITEPSPATTPKVSTSDLPTEEGEGESGGSSGTTTATSSRITSSTSTFSIKTKGFGFAPLASMFRVRSSGGTSQKPSTNSNTRNTDDVLEDPVSAADAESNVVDGDSRVDDDEDDRRTIRAGVDSTPTTPVARSRTPFSFEDEPEGVGQTKEEVPKTRRGHGAGKATTTGGATTNGHVVVGLRSEKEGIIKGGNNETASATVDTSIPHVR